MTTRRRLEAALEDLKRDLGRDDLEGLLAEYPAREAAKAYVGVDPAEAGPLPEAATAQVEANATVFSSAAEAAEALDSARQHVGWDPDAMVAAEQADGGESGGEGREVDP